MGNRFEFTVIADSHDQGEAAIDAAIREIQRIERLLTTFDDNSQTAAINRSAGLAPVRVDMEVCQLVYRSLKISALTQGAFDITYGSVDKRLWNFDRDMKALPDPATAKKMVHLVNFRNVAVDLANSTVFLKETGMRIGFGGIGKGYAADRAKMVLSELGIVSGVVNAAGDLLTWGSQADGQPWTIGLADPEREKGIFSSLVISNQAVATSGDYEKFVIIDGKRYAHTIDPRTGLPVSGIKSVTIICPSAELADAMATPVMVMGTRVGLDLIDQMKGIGCVIIDEHDRIFTSRNIRPL